ncbi:hypothetical protein [Hirschia litorea]|uniref:DUF1097 domain-containing protein n=1 Tax=Hirschia litorea TaxID=1199156 RepID=A0ABW2IKQ6_9PROT
MQSIIATFLGLIVSMTLLLIARGVGAGSLVGIGFWVIALWCGVFATAFLCPKKNATWFRSHLPAWIVVVVIITIGAFVYGAVFAVLPLWFQFPIAMAMSAGSMFLIWLAPRVSKRPSV